METKKEELERVLKALWALPQPRQEGKPMLLRNACDEFYNQVRFMETKVALCDIRAAVFPKAKVLTLIRANGWDVPV